MRMCVLFALCLLTTNLHNTEGKPATTKCRGIKARKHAIVTTASCVKGLRMSNLDVWTNNGRQQVVEVIGHPRYLNSSRRTYDIAVLKLAKPQPSKSRRLRAKIARRMPKGDVKSYVLDCQGKAIPVKILSKKVCNAQKGGQNPMDVICAYRRKLEEQRECQPLRGSPLVSGPYLVGLFTAAQQPQKPLRKDGGYVLMHTSAIGHRKWIKSMLKAVDKEAEKKEEKLPEDLNGISIRRSSQFGEDQADEEVNNQSTLQDTTVHPSTVLITTTEFVSTTEETQTVSTETPTNGTPEDTSSTQVEYTRRSEGSSPQEETQEDTNQSEGSSFPAFSTLYTSSSEEMSSREDLYRSMPDSSESSETSETEGETSFTQPAETETTDTFSITQNETPSTFSVTQNETQTPGILTTLTSLSSAIQRETALLTTLADSEILTTGNTAPSCASLVRTTKSTEADHDDEQEIDEDKINDEGTTYEDNDGEEEEDDDENDDDDGDGDDGDDDDDDEEGDEEDNDEEDNDEEDNDEEDNDEDSDEDEEEDEDDEPGDDEDEETESSEEYSSEEKNVEHEREVIVMAGSDQKLRRLRMGQKKGYSPPNSRIRSYQAKDGTLVVKLPRTAHRNSAIVVLGKH